MSFVGRVGIYSYGTLPHQKFFFIVLKDVSGLYANKLFIGTIILEKNKLYNHCVQKVNYTLSRIEWL
jgi:hypothetical protein